MSEKVPMDIDLYLKMGVLQGETSRMRETLIRIIDEVAEGHDVDALREQMKHVLMDLWDAHNELRGKILVDKTIIKPLFDIAPKSREEHILFGRAMRIIPEIFDAANAIKTIWNSVGAQMLAFATSPPLILQNKLLPLKPSAGPQPRLTLYSKDIQKSIKTSIDVFSSRAHGVVKVMGLCTGSYICGVRMDIPKVFSAVVMFEQFTYGQKCPAIGPVTVTVPGGGDSRSMAYPATPTNIPMYREITLCAERARDFFTLVTPDNSFKSFLVWLSKYDDLLLRPCKRCKKLFDSDSVEEERMLPIIRHPLTYEAFHKSCVPVNTFESTLPLLDPKVFEEPLFPDEEEEMKRLAVKMEEEKEGGGEKQKINDEGGVDEGDSMNGLVLKKVKLEN